MRKGPESAVNNPSVLLGKDTDLFIFFRFRFDLDSNDIYFKSIRTSSTTMEIWDIRKTASTLGLDSCHIMPFVPAISGCDKISNIWNGSAAFRKVLNKIRLRDDDVHES